MQKLFIFDSSSTSFTVKAVSTWKPALLTIPKELYGLLLITIHPEHVMNVILSTVNAIIAIGENPQRTIMRFSETLGESIPSVPDIDLEQGEAIMWWRNPRSDPFWFKITPAKSNIRRHRKKYAEGELPPERSFYFTGKENKLNLRAQNLMIFIQLTEGIDDETWIYHLRKGDYSKWFG